MKIIVASHRRSGTHLTIDTIINNSIPNFDLINFDHIRYSKFTLKDEIVYKTHCNGQTFNNEYSNFGFDKIIYVYRDGRDVMKSLYNYEARSCDMFSFLKEPNKYEENEYEKELSKLEYWGYHVNSWLGRDIYYLRFRELIDNYNETVNKLFDYLELDRVQNTKDIRQSNRLKYYFQKYILRKDITTVKFRGGKKGGYEKLFDDKSLDLYDEILDTYNIKGLMQSS